MDALGLIAGSGIFPRAVAHAARARGLRVVAVGHLGETGSDLAAHVDALHWVRVGQVAKTVRLFQSEGVQKAVMAGAIGHAKALKQARPDWGALKIAASLRSFRDDALLRAIAGYFESSGISILSPTELVPELLAPEGHLAGPVLNEEQRGDLALGVEVASVLGKVDVGQTVVVKRGRVFAVEALEGTDEAIRRGGKLAGPGAVVVKLCKVGQDTRFDLPAVGPQTLETMAEVDASVLAVESGRALLLDAEALLKKAERGGVSLVGLARP